MIKISQILIEASILKNKTHEEIIVALKEKVSGLISVSVSEMGEMEILKKSIDARKKPEIYYSFTVSLKTKNEGKILKRKIKNVEEYREKRFEIGETSRGTKDNGANRPKVAVVGFGPAGIGAAYLLAKSGFRPVIIERGSRVDERLTKVEAFWSGGPLSPDTNVQFGEGGAGAFSDGKLSTGNKDKDGLQRAILKTLVKYGGPRSIVYDSHPHVGTDLLRVVVRNIRMAIEEMGGEFLFDTKVTGIETVKEGNLRRITGLNVSPGTCTADTFLPVENVVLAVGHSARDTFRMLEKSGVVLTPKPFAVGYRVIHSQEYIDRTQYGPDFGEKGLPPSSYKLTYTAKSGTPVYSFCMCPGGYVVNSSSYEGGLCINGMSYSKRDGRYANSAVVMGVNVANGIEFQEELERKAFEIAGGKIPYCKNVSNRTVPVDTFLGECAEVPDMIRGNLILPENLNRDYNEAMEAFSRFIPGFNENTLAVAGVESRTSSPVRIQRDVNYESLEIKGLFPAGEGAGYAGGIMSAAMDGCRIAKTIISR